MLNKLEKWLEKYFLPVAGKIAQQKYIQAIKDGMVMTMPFLIVGSLALIIAYLPFPHYAETMSSIFGDMWKSKLMLWVRSTFDILSLIATFSIAFFLSKQYKLDGMTGGLLGIVGFVMLTPVTVTVGEKVVKAIPMQWLGAQGLFVGMFIAIISTEIYRFFIEKDIVIKMPDGVPPTVSKSFVALIPVFGVLLISWLINIVVGLVGFESIHQLITKFVAIPLLALGDTIFGAVIAVLAVQLLWSVGIHGAAVVLGVMGPIWISAQGANLEAFQAGAELPYIVTKQFIDLFTKLGGSGFTLPLVIMMLLFAKSTHMKKLGKLSLGPAVFNINEPVIFGMPIVMNPIMIIPFLIGPAVATIIAYYSMKLGFVPRPTGVALPWTMPAVVGGYLATNSMAGAILQIILTGISFVIYYPFFKLYDNKLFNEENKIANEAA